MRAERGDDVRAERLRSAGYNPEAMTHAEVVEAIGRGVLAAEPGAQIPQEEFVGRTPCPHPRVLQPCERQAPSRVGRLAPNLIAALIGFCAGADPSFEAFNRDDPRGKIRP